MNYSKEIKALKDVIQGLRTKTEELEEKVTERENHFSDKSEKWQESTAGINYQEKTESFDYEASELDDIIDRLEEQLSVLEGF